MDKGKYAATRTIETLVDRNRYRMDSYEKIFLIQLTGDSVVNFVFIFRHILLGAVHECNLLQEIAIVNTRFYALIKCLLTEGR